MRVRYSWFLIVFLLGSTGCHSREKETMTFEHPQVVCVGRLRMTVPGPGVVRLFKGFDLPTVDGVGLKWTPLDPGKSLADAWKERQDELSTGIHRWIRPLVSKDGRIGGVSDTSSNADSPDQELWQRYPDGIIKVLTYSDRGSEKIGVEYLNRILDNFHPGDMSTYRAGSFCVDGGAVDYASQYNEQLDVAVAFPPKNVSPLMGDHLAYKLGFDISMRMGQDDIKESVIQRHRRVQREALLHGIVIHILRTGKRTVAGMPGKEAIFRMGSDEYCGNGKSKCYTFSAEWEFAGAPHSRTQPATTIIFDNGSFPDSIPPEHLIQVWDTVLNSMTMGR